MNTNKDWLDIASAPKDGTSVLLFARHADAEASTRVVGSFDGNENGLGWHAQCYVGQPFARLVPSHWMPLPCFPGVCATCNGWGMIGGPSFYAPDEGGEPCPDCSPAAPAYTVTVDPDPRGVSVGVYLGSSCVYNGAHPIPAGSALECDWELECDDCAGNGYVLVKHQVAERKTDVQEFKEVCECCEGRGFVFAFEDIPGIAEYVRRSRPASTVATEGEKDETITPADAVYGLMAWLSGRDEVVTLSARHGAAIAADLANAFCNANRLHQFSQGYPDNLKYPSTGVTRSDISDSHPSPVPEADGAKAPAVPLAWQTAAKKAIKFANSIESRTHATTAVEHIHALAELILSAPAAGDALERLHSFLNGAAGEGVSFAGVDADQLYIQLFPERYAAAIAPPATGDALDAQRYRWLRDESWAGYNEGKRQPQVAETCVFIAGAAGNVRTILAEEALDAAVDAAIAQQNSEA